MSACILYTCVYVYLCVYICVCVCVCVQVIVLQSHWRRWLGTRYVSALRREKQARQQWEREREEERQRAREEREKREFQRRMNPKTKEDFELLYHALEGESVM